MAFNWKTFNTRALTAIVFVAVMMAGLLINQWSFFILFSVIHFGCWWEYFKLTEKKLPDPISYLYQTGIYVAGLWSDALVLRGVLSLGNVFAER
jgi:phosphatidate cytidylyltransferase